MTYLEEAFESRLWHVTCIEITATPDETEAAPIHRTEQQKKKTNLEVFQNGANRHLPEADWLTSKHSCSPGTWQAHGVPYVVKFFFIHGGQALNNKR